MRGYLYVVSNSCLPGLLKIGYTTRNLTERIKELSSTGVPNKFCLEFYCEVDFAKKLEGEVHHSLRSFHYGKEFFKCTVQDAVKIVKLQFHGGEFCVYGTGGRSKNAFLTDAEVQEFVKQKKLKDEELKKKEYEQNLIEKFFKLSIPAEEVIKKYCVRMWHGGNLQKLAGLALVVTIPLHLGVGLSLINKLCSDSFEDGKKAAAKMTQSERVAIRELFEAIKILKNINAWPSVAQKYYSKQKEPYLIVWRESKSRPGVSDFLGGVFSGLGLVTPIGQVIAQQ